MSERQKKFSTSTGNFVAVEVPNDAFKHAFINDKISILRTNSEQYPFWHEELDKTKHEFVNFAKFISPEDMMTIMPEAGTMKKFKEFFHQQGVTAYNLLEDPKITDYGYSEIDGWQQEPGPKGNEVDYDDALLDYEQAQGMVKNYIIFKVL